MNKEKLKSALHTISPTCTYGEWLNYAMAAKSGGLTFEDFHEWSKLGTNYVSELYCSKLWESIKKDGGITEATIYRIALDNGWVDDKININTEHKQPKNNIQLVEGTFTALPARRISKRTCEFFNYQVGVNDGKSCHIANYGGWQKLRYADKTFETKGDKSKITLFGKHKWAGNGNSIIITEGEIDALSIAEAQDCKWPVVSLPTGAQSAKRILQNELDWLLGFKSIILCFDSDDAGRIAVENCVDLFPPGRVKIASLSEKDANECLMKGKFEELTKLVFNASEYRPDGIVWGSEIDFKELRKPQPRGLTLPYPILDEMIRGIKPSRIYMIYAGTGLGKSTCLKEIGYFFKETNSNIKIANIFLEEGLGFTATTYIAMQNNIPTYQLEENPNLLTEKQWLSGQEFIKDFGFYQHFGSLDSKRLNSLLDYLAIGHGVKIILLDHITLLMSGLESSGEGERRDLDILMTNLRSFCERTGASVIAATQLKRKKGAYSEGEEIVESDARGSGGIEHLSDVIFSLNIDTTSENPYDAQIKVVKNRITGRKGNADLITYNFETGRYLPKKLESKKQDGEEMY